MVTKTEFGERISAKVQTELKVRDRRVKIWLLSAGAITLLLLAFAAVKENFLSEWRLHQLEYKGLLQAKTNNEAGRKTVRDFEVKIRQIVLPDLGTVDRCVSCHVGIDDPRMTDVKQPYRMHPGDYLKWHDVNDMGCTICHRGQGPALVFEDAKAEGRHWDYPLLPGEYTQSACGVCHSVEEVARKGGSKLVRGRRLFERRGCLSCHQIGGRGGTLGPKLDDVGRKVTGQIPLKHIGGPHTLPEWLKEHFEDPQKVVENSQMPRPGLTPGENEALTTYMLSLQERDLPSRYLSPEKHLEVYKRARPDPKSGKELFSTFCARCHDTGRVGEYDKFFRKFMPAVRGETYVQTAGRKYLKRNIEKGHPGTLMPAWEAGAGGLTEGEIERIVDFLEAAPVSPSLRLPSEALTRAGDRGFRAKGDAGRGAALFNKQCAGCHGPRGVGGVGPAIRNPVFQAAAGDGFIFTTIAYGRRNTAMPGFLGAGVMTEQEIEDLVAYVRILDAAAAGKALQDAKENKP